MIIKFNKSMPPYQAGEIAGFPKEEARKIIESGYAVEYKQEAAEVDKMVRNPKAKK